MTMKRVLVVLALAVCVSTQVNAFTPGSSVTNVASGLSGGAKRAPFAGKYVFCDANLPEWMRSDEDTLT
jgi:hypothetical protein